MSKVNIITQIEYHESTDSYIGYILIEPAGISGPCYRYLVNEQLASQPYDILLFLIREVRSEKNSEEKDLPVFECLKDIIEKEQYITFNGDEILSSEFIGDLAMDPLFTGIYGFHKTVKGKQFFFTWVEDDREYLWISKKEYLIHLENDIQDRYEPLEGFKEEECN